MIMQQNRRGIPFSVQKFTSGIGFWKDWQAHVPTGLLDCSQPFTRKGASIQNRYISIETP
jgi:hypothetical protein